MFLTTFLIALLPFLGNTEDTVRVAPQDTIPVLEVDTTCVLDADTARVLLQFNEDSLRVSAKPQFVYEDNYLKGFNPKPWKAVWWSLLVPGGGQIYNRKYWKLPIVYGGFLALIYGYNWNQRYYRTYQTAFREISTDIENQKLGIEATSNPTYLDLIRGGTLAQRKEYARKNQSYLQSTFKNKKNTYRNYRDYCVVGMLAVYLVSVIDAYVDAAMFKFDVSPELSPDGETTMMVNYSIDF